MPLPGPDIPPVGGSNIPPNYFGPGYFTNPGALNIGGTAGGYNSGGGSYGNSYWSGDNLVGGSLYGGSGGGSNPFAPGGGYYSAFNPYNPGGSVSAGYDPRSGGPLVELNPGGTQYGNVSGIGPMPWGEGEPADEAGGQRPRARPRQPEVRRGELISGPETGGLLTPNQYYQQTFGGLRGTGYRDTRGSATFDPRAANLGLMSSQAQFQPTNTYAPDSVNRFQSGAWRMTDGGEFEQVGERETGARLQTGVLRNSPEGIAAYNNQMMSNQPFSWLNPPADTNTASGAPALPPIFQNPTDEYTTPMPPTWQGVNW